VSDDSLNGRTPADILALAERVLGFAEKESPTEVEVMAMADDGSLTRFANSEIHQNVAESNVQVNLRFVAGKRVGVASTIASMTRPCGASPSGPRRSPATRGARGLGRPAGAHHDPRRAGGLRRGEPRARRRSSGQRVSGP
jgi:hypothetical protein